MDRIDTTNTAYMASALATLAGYSINELVALAGIAIALLTFLVNLVFKYLHYRLAEKASQRQNHTFNPEPKTGT